ncbi:MAG TPA: hypothetical protein VFR86_14550 [Burkholderiaceae bacterium]|nr:hypothetical protein [Burkholderiaceae bacterium]
MKIAVALAHEARGTARREGSGTARELGFGPLHERVNPSCLLGVGGQSAQLEEVAPRP